MAENLNCPRCRKPFLCKADKIEQCGCRNVDLSPETRDYLESTDYGCLCPNCLKELNKIVEVVHESEFSPNAPLIEGVHYYLEDGMFVFTELYHIWKGHCCRKGCRHCAYGYDPSSY